jgi:branched-chain amino acid transport system ATP-binding protein
LVAVNKVTLNISEGLITALIGPNGSGKTTVFNLISGILRLTEGSIQLGDMGIDGLRPDQILKLGISRTFQELRIFKSLTVIENVMLGLQAKAKSGTLSSLLGLPKERRERKLLRERAEELLDLLGIADRKDLMPQTLPYGEQRITDIARALASRSKMLMLDEPAAGMNPKEKEQLSRTLVKIQEEICNTIFLIEHDMKFVMGLSDYVGVLNFGTLIGEGVPADIQKNEGVIRAYLGTE